jgi:hypothetical protein
LKGSEKTIAKYTVRVRAQPVVCRKPVTRVSFSTLMKQQVPGSEKEIFFSSGDFIE